MDFDRDSISSMACACVLTIIAVLSVGESRDCSFSRGCYAHHLPPRLHRCPRIFRVEETRIPRHESIDSVRVSMFTSQKNDHSDSMSPTYIVSNASVQSSHTSHRYCQVADTVQNCFGALLLRRGLITYQFVTSIIILNLRSPPPKASTDSQIVLVVLMLQRLSRSCTFVAPVVF